MMAKKTIASICGAILVATLYLVPATSNAGSITTLFDYNNGGNAGGAVYFDLTVGPNALTIMGLDTNACGGGNPDISVCFEGNTRFFVYTKLGTAFGSELDAAAWTLQTGGTLHVNALNVPSPVHSTQISF